MGGSQSTEPRSVTPPISDQPAVPAGPPAKVGDNNNGDVVVIAVDASKQAETAFRCTQLLLTPSFNPWSTKIFVYKPWGPKFFFIFKSCKCLS